MGVLLSSFFQSVLRWSVAVSTICHHSSRVVAFLQAVARPKFRRPRSASIAQSQVWLGLPAGRFQSGSTCRMHAARARWWSSRGEGILQLRNSGISINILRQSLKTILPVSFYTHMYSAFLGSVTACAFVTVSV